MTNSIDLIPKDYRESIARRRSVRYALASVVLVCLVASGASASLSNRASAIKAETDQMNQERALLTLLDKQMLALDQEQQLLDEEWMLLNTLRSGFAAEDLFHLIDDALPGDDIWFIDWSFKRAGVVAQEGVAGTNTGYFIVVNSDATGKPEPAWQIETHMSIVGQAVDHAALSKFVRGLYQQQQIESVKLNQTRVREYADRSVVDFELAIVLLSEPAA